MPALISRLLGRAQPSVAAPPREDAEALMARGSSLLVGLDPETKPTPAEEREGADLIARAAELGHAEALTLLASLTALGGLVPQSWPGAFDRLAEGAERGSPWARRQLAILSADRDLAARADMDADPNRWRRLRDGIDLQAWTAPPPKHRLLETPRIRVAPGLASPEVCDWLIERARDRLSPGTMYDNRERKPSWWAARTCTEYQFDLLRFDVVLQLLWARIAVLIGLPTSHLEAPRVFHYAEGEEIKGHFDHVGTRRGEDQSLSSERIITTLIYLNDDFEGGELDFPKVGFRHKGRKGDAVFFANVDLTGKPDPKSFHAGLPVTRGEKWLLSQWSHDQPFRG